MFYPCDPCNPWLTSPLRQGWGKDILTTDDGSKCQFSLLTLNRRLIELTSRQQQTQRTLLDWLRVEYGIEKPSNKLLALTDLDSNTWVSEVKRIRGKKQPLSSAGLHALRDEPAQCGVWSSECGVSLRRRSPYVANRPAPHADPAARNMNPRVESRRDYMPSWIVLSKKGHKTQQMPVKQGFYACSPRHESIT